MKVIIFDIGDHALDRIAEHRDLTDRYPGAA